MAKSFNLSTRALRAAPWGEKVERVMQAGLQAVEPGNAVQRAMQCSENTLTIHGENYDLKSLRRIRLAAIGKAAAPMTQAACEIIGQELTDGIIITKAGHAHFDGYPKETSQWMPRLEIIESGHPIPNELSEIAGQKITEFFQKTQADDLVICLISGGGSALLTAPIPGVTLADLQQLTGILLACGANIHEINTLRKHLDTLKGGGLAKLISPARLIALVLSDVVGDDLDVIASGLTVPDRSTFEQAHEIVTRYRILEKIPPRICKALLAGRLGQIAETPKPGNEVFSRIRNHIIGSNQIAAQAALTQARNEDLNGLLLTTFLQGEAQQAGRILGAIARQAGSSGHPIPRPACLIAGGETTVTLTGTGRGGRNQELALAAVRELAGLPNTVLVALSTDGGDGPTTAAGAVVTGDTYSRATQLGLSPENYLLEHNSFPFFEALGDLLLPGPTQTNVNDLALIFTF